MCFSTKKTINLHLIKKHTALHAVKQYISNAKHKARREDFFDNAK